MSNPDCDPAKPGEIAQPKAGKLRHTARAGLAVLMLAQLMVWWDLRWIGARVALALAGLAMVAALPNVAALLWGRTFKATLAAGIGCLLTGLYLVATYPWSYFAGSRHGWLYLPLFPLFVLAMAVVLRDSVRGALHATAATLQTAASASTSTLGLLGQLERTKPVVPVIYAITAAILLTHSPVFLLFRPFFPVCRTIAGALNWSMGRGKPWPHNFAWLPILAGLALSAAVALRTASRSFSDRLALSGSVMGCVYGVLAFRKLAEVIAINRSMPAQFRSMFTGGIVEWPVLAASLAPVLLCLRFAVHDSVKWESWREILPRVAATLCFAVTAASLHLDWYSTQDLVPACMFTLGLGYLSYALYPTFFYDFALGASFGESTVALALLGFAVIWGHEGSLVLAAALSNAILLLTALISGSGPGDELGLGRIVTGFLIGVGLAAVTFLTLFFFWLSNWH